MAFELKDDNKWSVLPPPESPDFSMRDAATMADVQAPCDNDRLHWTSEKSGLFADISRESGNWNNAKVSRRAQGRYRSLIGTVIFLGLSILMIWFLPHFISGDEEHETYDGSYTPSLVRDDVSATISSMTATSTPILEVFQVYQPVLTPTGLIDETISSDGIANTTSLTSPNSTTACSKVLMDHSFGYSYGQPFVGKTPYFCIIAISLRYYCKDLWPIQGV